MHCRGEQQNETEVKKVEGVGSILECIYDRACSYGNILCICDKTTTTTYQSFYDMVECGASYLSECGIRGNEIVVMRAKQSVGFLVAFFSIQLCGAIPCPIEKNISEARIREILDEMSPCVYMGYGKDSGYEGGISLDQFFKRVRDENGKEREGNKTLERMPERPVVKPENIADIIYTTGTTGKSKGIMMSHRADVAIAQNVIDSVGMRDGEVELITTPINHSLALRRIFGAMLNGSTAVLMDKFIFVEDFFNILDQYKVTSITFVPSILKSVVETSGERLGEYNGQLHYVQIGSSRLSENQKSRLRELLPDVKLYNTYGATESGCTLIFEFSRYNSKPGCVGRTTVNTTLSFVGENGETVQAVNEDSAGYMVFAGPMNMNGYYGEPGLTREVLRGGLIYTNDVGYIGDDGLVYLIGRADDVINSGGLKINPAEVEEAAMASGLLDDCACKGEADKLLGQKAVLFVIPKDKGFNDANLRRHLKHNMEQYKVPKDIRVVEKIPRAFNGKILRREL